jgi:hypothetical protein
MLVLLIGLISPAALYAQTPTTAQTAPQTAGRYQLVLVPGHPGSPFLLDSATGCMWHQVQDEKTKRTSFTEVDVENLHWSYSSGAQTLLAARIDASSITDEQKRALKQDLQKTGCGNFNVVLAPAPPPQAGGAPAPKATPKDTPKQESPKEKKK